MSVTRVKISSASGGAPVALTFPSNPTAYDARDSDHISSFQIFEGGAIHHQRGWDGRLRTMTWNKNEVGTTFIEPIDTYFRSIVGKIRYINFGDLDTINGGWPTTDTWKKVRIVKVSANYKPGGLLRYENFSIVFQPER